jgi:SAM-dependent methyltransferase
MDIDDPQTTVLRRSLIKDNGFLLRTYESWYQKLLTQIPETGQSILELGSGGGFLNEVKPNIISSEVFFCPHIQIILDGQSLPFGKGKLSGIVLTNVLHHVPNVRMFFAEAARCVRPRGIVAMIEPWITPWSKWVYQHLHHEPFDPTTTNWEFPATGPLSAANGALPWLIFKRDRAIFENDFPEWQIEDIQPIMPFCYLVSGGVSMRQLMPTWSFPIWHGIEKMLDPWMDSLAMFSYIKLQRKTET